MFAVIFVLGYSTLLTSGFITSIIAFSVATVVVPPNLIPAVAFVAVVAVAVWVAAVFAVVIVYESIPTFWTDVWVLLIWSNGIPSISYSSIAAPEVCAIAPVGLVILVTEEPEIVPLKISSSLIAPVVESLGTVIFSLTEPLPGNPVLLVNVSEVSEAPRAPLRVVLTPEDTPLIVTLFDVEYIWWFLCVTFTTPELASDSNGFSFSVLSSVGAFVNTKFDVLLVSNFAR